MIRILPGVIIFVLWLYCLINVVTSRADGIRHLGKMVWLAIVFFFPLIGSILWLVAGRPVAERPLTREQGAAPSFPEYERRGRFAAADPEKDEEFLRHVRERAEEQRRRYEEQKRAEREAQQSKDEDGTDPDPVS